MKYKVALCISGQARDVHRCYGGIKENFIDPFDTDVYVHSWSGDETWNADIGKKGWKDHLHHTSKSGEYVNFIEAERDICGIDVNSGETPNDITELYKPVMSEIESQRFEYKGVKWGMADNHIRTPAFSGFFSQWRSIELALNSSKKYDYIVKMRTDILFQRKIDWRFLCPGAVWIPRGHNWGGLNDHWAIGSPSAMKHYGEIYFGYINKKERPHLIAHHVVAWWLKKHGVTVFRIPNYGWRNGYVAAKELKPGFKYVGGPKHWGPEVGK